MNLGVIIIGDEILNGQVCDVNTGEIARQIASVGGKIVSTSTIGDNQVLIQKTIQRFLEDDTIDAIITTGGLGPTKDDVTKKVFCDLTGGKLVLNDEMLSNVRQILEKRGVPINSSSESQAMVPDTCTPIRNVAGTAPVMWFDIAGKVIVAMPGVPFETKLMLEASVVPMLANNFSRSEFFTQRTLLLTGISESAVSEKIASWEDSLPEGCHLAYLPNIGYLRLRLDVKGYIDTEVESRADELAWQLKSLLSEHYLHDRDETPQRILQNLLIETGLTFGSAESCTGGNIAAAMTSLPGSSECTKGAVVAYSNEIKTSVLGVDESILAMQGAVCEDTVREMACGVKQLLNCDVAVSTSGIAGPGGAVPGKPVGTICSAINVDGLTATFTDHFRGSRQLIVERTVNTVLIRTIEMVREFRQLRQKP